MVEQAVIAARESAFDAIERLRREVALATPDRLSARVADTLLKWAHHQVGSAVEELDRS